VAQFGDAPSRTGALSESLSRRLASPRPVILRRLHVHECASPRGLHDALLEQYLYAEGDFGPVATRVPRSTSAHKTHGVPPDLVLSVYIHERVLNSDRCTIRGHQAIFPIITASIHAKEIVAKNGRPTATVTEPSIRVVSHPPSQDVCAGRLATNWLPPDMQTVVQDVDIIVKNSQKDDPDPI
jgi:hypothetical protein